MTDAVHTLLEWWNLMAEMHAKYGATAQIDEKPEWLKLQETQQELLRLLKKHTGTASNILFKNLQDALLSVLGTEETTLSFEDARAVLQLTVRLSVGDEAQIARMEGILN